MPLLLNARLSHDSPAQASTAATAKTPDPGPAQPQHRGRRGLLTGLGKLELPHIKPPTRMNGKIGYPLGSERPPRLPGLGEERAPGLGRPPAPPPTLRVPANHPRPPAGPSSPPASDPTRNPSGVATHFPITATHVDRWRSMPQPARDQIGVDGYAAHFHLNPVVWRNTVSPDGGLTPRGEALIDADWSHRH